MDNLRPQDETFGGQRVFSCEMCGEEFPSRDELKIVSLIHRICDVDLAYRKHYESPFAHGNRAEQSPHFPPLSVTRSLTPPKLDLGSIDTDQDLPSFGMPGEDSEKTIVSVQTDSDDSAPATTESVHFDSNIDSNGSDHEFTHDTTTPASQIANDKAHEPQSSSGSDDEIITPHHSVHLAKPQPYIPTRIADIETPSTCPVQEETQSISHLSSLVHYLHLLKLQLPLGRDPLPPRRLLLPVVLWMYMPNISSPTKIEITRRS